MKAKSTLEVKATRGMSMKAEKSTNNLNMTLQFLYVEGLKPDLALGDAVSNE